MRTWAPASLLAPLFALLLVVSACDSNDSSSSLDCSLSTDPLGEGSDGGFTVELSEEDECSTQ